jgi:hypothetical protein
VNNFLKDVCKPSEASCHFLAFVFFLFYDISEREPGKQQQTKAHFPERFPGWPKIKEAHFQWSAMVLFQSFLAP